MLELTVTSLLGYLIPAVIRQQFDYLTNFHGLPYLSSPVNEECWDRHRNQTDHITTSVSRRSSRQLSPRSSTVEELLHRLAYHPERLTETADTVDRYRDLVHKYCTADEERELLKRFFATWDAVVAGWRLP